MAKEDKHIRPVIFARNFGHQMALTAGVDMEAAQKLDLPLNIGTEMNSPGQRFVDQFETAELSPFVPVFLKDKTRHSAGADTAVRTAKLMADAGFPEAFIVLADENGSIKERT